jgi:hypothetical protein
LLELGRWDYYWLLWVGGNLAGLVIPVLAFIFYSYLKYGETGLKTYMHYQSAPYQISDSGQTGDSDGVQSSALGLHSLKVEPPWRKK